MRKYLTLLVIFFGCFNFQSIYAIQQDSVQQKSTIRTQLQNTSWIILSVNGKTVTYSGEIQFFKNSFNAKICNNVNGKFHVIQKSLIVRNILSTMMYCEGGSMDLEYSIGNANRAQISIQGDILTLITKQNDTLVWKKK